MIPERLPLHWQILGGFLALQTVALAASLWIVNRGQSQRIEREARGQLELARDVFESVLEERRRRLTSGVALLAKDYAFKQALATGDRATIASAAANAGARIGAERLWVADERGRIAKAPGGLSRSPLIAAALGGAPSAEVRVLDGKAYQLVAAPVMAPDPFAAIVAGFPVDDAMALDLKRITGSELSFDDGSTLLASTLDEESRVLLRDSLGSLAQRGTAVIGPVGRRQIVLAAPLGAGLFARVQRSWEDLAAPAAALRRSLLMVGAAAVALTALLGYVIAGRITASIEHLIERLRESNEELSRVNGFQTNFFSMVAHDLKNPLQSVRGYAELLESREADPELKRMCEVIAGGVGTLNFLIGDLVDFAAMENGVLRISPRRIDLSAVVSGVGDRMAMIASGRGVAFNADLPADLPPVEADPDRVAQVLQNLCGNALQYTPRGGRVTVGAAIEGAFVRVRVSDSGIGIAPRDLPRIFERFFQADNARKMRKAGFGLGLKIAREIVERQGGRMEAESVLGRGSTFSFTLPVSKERCPASGSAAGPTSA